VLDCDGQASGASVHNFSKVTVSGQSVGETWARARRSREIWADIALKAGMENAHVGLVVLARRPEAGEGAGTFARTEMCWDAARAGRFLNLRPKR